MMMTVRADGPADPDVVWDRYVRPGRWPDWSPQIRSVSYPDEKLSAGGRGVVNGPCGLSIDFVVDEVDEINRHWRWRVTRAGIALTLDHSVSADMDGEATGSGTTTALDISGPAPIVLGYAPIARIALGRLVR